MSEANNGAIVIPDCVTRFQFDGAVFSLDLSAAWEKMKQIVTECEGRTDFAHLHAFSAWLQTQGAPAMPLGKVDWLWDTVFGEYDREKKARRPLPEPRLPSSTELTPGN